MTIKDIARECGVGVSTVSRVLNNRPDVSDDVRRRILDYVEASGYVPNNTARDLVKTSSDAIGVVVRGTGNLFFSEMLKTISAEIESCGYSMVLRIIESGADEVKAGAELEREKKLLGIIFLGGRYNYTPAELSTITVPFVCCSYDNSFGSLEPGAYSSVSVDDVATAALAVNEFIKRGHQRIALLLPSRSDHSVSELRFNGYMQELERFGITPDPLLIAESGSFELSTAYSATTGLLSRTRDFTALLCASDVMALAAMKAIADQGLKVPDDISIIAIDGLEFTAYSMPTLASMQQPAEQMALESVRCLVNTIKSGKTRHIFPVALLRSGESLRSI